MTSLADQKTLNDLTKKFDGRTPVRIHFLDNSSKVFLMHEYASFKDLITLCLDKLSIVDKQHVLPYFAIFESKNGGSIDGSFPLDALVLEVIRGWAEQKIDKTAKFLFMIRLYMPCLWGFQHKDVVAYTKKLGRDDITIAEYLEAADIIDPSALHLQFIQGVYNVITGKYPTSIDEAINLGAIHFLFKFGNYRSDRHVVGFLGNRIVEFVPVKHLKNALTGNTKKGASGETLAHWEARLLDKVKELAKSLVYRRDQSSYREADEGDEGGDYAGHEIFFQRVDGTLISPQRKYLELIYCMVPIFGSSFFKCTQKSSRALPDTVNLAPYSEGVHVFDKNKKLVRSFHIEDILRWGFKPNQTFFFEVNPEIELGTGSLEFETDEGKVISDLLTDYALAFLKEREKEEERLTQLEQGLYHLPSSLVRPPPPSASGVAAAANNGHHLPPPPAPPSSNRTSKPINRTYTPKEQRAAVKVQALYRGFALRNEWAREDAAILIQSVFRGYKARILLSKIIEQMIKDGLL